MAETTKKTTTKKATTTKSTKKDTSVDVNSLQEQMQQMMLLMSQQQQMINQLSLQNNQEAKPQKEAKRVRSSETKPMTKQYLRREYKDVEVYLRNVTHGIVSYKGRDGIDYIWETTDDIQALKIDDIVTMDSKFLTTPWLVLDEFENSDIILEEIIAVLNLEAIYEHLYVLSDLEEDINNVDLDKVSRLLKKNNDLVLDVCACIQQKIKSGELESYKRIEQFEKIIGRKFEMQG